MIMFETPKTQVRCVYVKVAISTNVWIQLKSSEFPVLTLFAQSLGKWNRLPLLAMMD